MKRIIGGIAVLVFLVGFIQPVFADGDVGKLISEGKAFFVDKKWGRAMDRFNLASELATDKANIQAIAFYKGAIYAQMNLAPESKTYLKKYLATGPSAPAGADFTEEMTQALENARGSFPIVTGIGSEMESFKPYGEKLVVSFKVTAEKQVLMNTVCKFQLLSSTGAIRREIDVKKPSPGEQNLHALWDGKDKQNAYVLPGEYFFAVQVSDNAGWSYTYKVPVVIDGNLNSPETQGMIKRADRIGLLAGKRKLDYLPARPFKEVGEEPRIGTSKGFWNKVYYVFIGSIRDGIDFPIKFLCSQPVIGHLISFPLIVGGSYSMGVAQYSIEREDYFDKINGGYDDEAWDHDTTVVNTNRTLTTVFGTIWVGAYAGVMSVLSWAGTDGGIVGGFNSYFESNAWWNGYDSKYFFPNYRSLTFSDIKVDDEELEMLRDRIADKNDDIKKEIAQINHEREAFNKDKMDPFRDKIAKKYNRKLRDHARMTVKKR